MEHAQKAANELVKEVAALASRVTIDDDCMHQLRELYAKIFIEACYDPFNDHTQAYAQKLWPHIVTLNDKLKFKR